MKKVGISIVMMGIIALIMLCAPGDIFRAHAQIPFGGMVTATVYCDEGIFLYLDESIQGGVQYSNFMWAYGNLQYERYVIPHPGQWLLGKWSGVMTCSMEGEVVNAAPMILWHGEGI